MDYILAQNAINTLNKTLDSAVAVKDYHESKSNRAQKAIGALRKMHASAVAVMQFHVNHPNENSNNIIAKMEGWLNCLREIIETYESDKSQTKIIMILEQYPYQKEIEKSLKKIELWQKFVRAH